ncbi:MAG: DUF4908 domain-containing protein [Caulobacterales bacterium]
MATLARAVRSIVMFAAVGTAAALSGFVAAAPASPLSLRTAVASESRKDSPPPVARYQVDDGGDFILDRTNPQPLLKFEGAPEIWVLQPSTGPRGDIIYKNELGLEVLRSTRMGGMTVFTERRPEGSPAALEGPSLPLRLQALSFTALFQRIYQASVRASRAAQHPVLFDGPNSDLGYGPDADENSAGIIADAALIASEAFVFTAARPGGRLLLSRINHVVILLGANPGVTRKGATIVIVINPAEGLAGRPSSLRIQYVAGLRPARLR